MTFNSQNQTHVAQQYRREKLRIPGTQPPVSPERDENGYHMSRSRSSMGFSQSPSELKRAKTFNAFGFSSEFETARAGSMLPNAMDNVGQAYNTEVMSSDSFNFPNGAGSVYGSQSLYPREISTQMNRSSNPSNWGLGLHGQMPQNVGGSIFVAVESSNFQNNINNDHQAQDTPAVETILVGTNLHNRCVSERKKDLSIDPYVGSSNNHPQALQLSGLNQDFHIYPDSVQGNVLLVGPSPGGGMESHQTVCSHETHIAGIQLPTHAFAQIQLPHQPTMTAMPVAEQVFQSNVLVPHLGNQNSNNWQNGGSELLFVPMPGCTESNRQGTAEPSQTLNFDHTSTWSVPDYDTRRSLILQGPDKALIRGGMGQCLHIDQSHNGNNGQYQGLSLSLSSHQPSAMQLNSFQVQLPSAEHAANSSMFSHTMEDSKVKLSDGLSNRFHVYINPLQNSRDLFLASDLKNEDSKVLAGAKQFNYNSGLSTLSSDFRMLSSSKYLKAARHLLDEVCTVVGPVEKDGNNSGLTENKPHEWRVSKSSPYGSLQSENRELESVKKDVADLGAAASAPSVPCCVEDATALTQEERQDFQIRKTKLLSMLQEVDRQYRQYYDHMQAVIFSFDSAIGQVGVARPYTRMALKAMSRHFRSLRDTISNQIQITCKALGEEDISEPGPLRKVASRLRFVDQQLRQQRALQQLGMLQQPAWRPQRGLPEHSVSVLRAWLFEHFLHPYPKDADKMMLARQTGLSRSQVSNWFINARVRLWKPMVEEMYTEENRENEQEASVKRVNQQADDGISCEQNICENRDGNSIHHKGMMREESKQNQGDLDISGKVLTEDPRHYGSFDTKNAGSDYVLRRIIQPDITNVQPIVSSPNSEMPEEGMNKDTDMPFRQNVHKAYSSGLLNSSVFDRSMNLRPKDTASETLYEDDYKVRSSKKYSTYPFAVQNGNTFLHHTATSDAYTIGDRNLSIYSEMDVAPNIFGSAGVSLTLGLQHVDSLSQATSHNYVHSVHNPTESDGAHDFHLNAISHPGDSDHVDGHESLNFQGRKHVANHLLHEFVA